MMALMLKFLCPLHVAGFCNCCLINFPEENVGISMCVCVTIYIHTHTHVCKYIYTDM